MANDSAHRPPRALARPRAGGDDAASVILGALPATEWTVFGGVRVPGRRTTLQVAVGPQGVFVIEPLRATARRRSAPVSSEGVSQRLVVRALRAAAAVNALTGLVEARHVTPVVCFLGRELEPVVAGDVVLCSSRNLLAILTHAAPVLDAERRALVSLDLDTSLRASHRAHRRARAR